MTDLPILGAAIKLEDFTQIEAWMRDSNRALEIQDFVSAAALTDHRDDILARWKPHLDGYGGDLGIHGPFLGLDFATPDPEVRKVVQMRLLQGLEVAEALGATQMVFHSPFSPWLENNRWNFPFIREGMFADGAECLAPVLERAALIGCTLVLENIEDTDPRARMEFVRSINHPCLRLSIDTGHAHLSHCNHHGASVTDFIDAAEDMLHHVHIQDVDGHADRHWHPGEGVLPWGGIFRALGMSASTPRLLIEPWDRPHLLPKCVARLQALDLAR